EMLRYAMDEAGRLGMRLDMPPGSGWRSGGPFVLPEQANASLHLTADSAPAGTVWTRDLHSRRVQAVAAFGTDGQFVDLMDRVDSSGTLSWTAPAGDWTVYVAETRPSGEKVKRPSPGGGGLTIDPFSRASVDSYLAAYGQRTSAIPSGRIRAFFHDSFEYTGNWTPDLFEEFNARRGYDLARHLPALRGRGDPDEIARVKSDYRETLSELLRENFLLPLTAWAHKHGSLSRNQAHGSPGNLLDLYAASDIPETELFGPLGGTDSDPLISRFACSAAHVAGKRLCSSETGTWLGEHFTVSLAQLKQEVDQLFLSGVNHVVFHGTAYSPQDAAWPGWLFYASSQINPRNPIWHDLPALVQYVTRSQSILQAGTPANDVLLYWPIYDNWHDTTGLRMSFAVHDPEWFYTKPVSRSARWLLGNGYGFDYVSDLQLAGASVAPDRRIRMPGSSYRAVVVPATRHMPVRTFQALLDLARAGATVLFQGGLPADVPGLGRLPERRGQMQRLRSEVLRLATSHGRVRQAVMGKGRLALGDSLGALLAWAGIAGEPMTKTGIRFIRRKDAVGQYYFIRNAGQDAFQGWLPLAVPAASVGLMDPMTGKTGLAWVHTNPHGGVEVYLQLEPGASMILRTTDEPMSGSAWIYYGSAGPSMPIMGRWHVTFTEGGPGRPASFDTDTLVSWTVLGGGEAARFAGTARHTIRFDAPGEADNYRLDLGNVAASARVRLNGRALGTLLASPFQIQTGALKPSGNVLEVDVTNLAANRIRDLDRRDVPWKIFYDINFVNLQYQPFDASDWPLRPSGLLGPVTLTPLHRIKW
ncbi:MAG TPA: glycosyl hydrolase, partial [Rhodothermales bacterium]|nr:glycosyl hydrolase [Rhodothermales bacterium]